MNKRILFFITLILLLSTLSCWEPVSSDDINDQQNDPGLIFAVKDSLGNKFIQKTDSTAVAGIASNLFIDIKNYYNIDSIGAYYLIPDQSDAEKVTIPVTITTDSTIHLGEIIFKKSGLVPLYYFAIYEDSLIPTVVDVINFYVKGNAPNITANNKIDTLFSIKEMDTLKIQYKITSAYTYSSPFFSTIDSLPFGASFDTSTGIFTYIPTDSVTTQDSSHSLAPIYIIASDNSVPPISDTMPLYISVIDSLINTDGPIITQLTGVKESERITVAVDTLTFDIIDSDGIDTVYYKLNDAYITSLSKIATNTYQLILNLTKYGSNKIEIISSDGSQKLNKTTKLININYNTIPSSINNISPIDGAEGIDHSSGVTLNWNEGVDADGDSITYIIGYSSNTSAFTIVNTTDKSCLLKDLLANTTYNWYVQVATSLDTVRCPNGENTYFSFKTKDEGAPSITQKTGPIEGDYVKTSSNVLTFDITDVNGLDSVYYQLNGDTAIPATNTLNDEYKITVTLSDYGSNEIILTAIDGSSEHNKSIKIINIIYYSIPSIVDALYPANNTLDIENNGGITLKWTKATDDDGDSIKYELFYGENSSSMTSAVITDTTYTVNNLVGDTEYSWFVNVITEHDTIRCPEGTSSFWKFTTINHPTEISGFPDKSCTINDTISYTVTANDAEGVKEYQWDYNGDGIVDEVSTIGTIKIKANSSAGIQKVILTVKDNFDKLNQDTSIVTISNESPILSNSLPKDFTTIDYESAISLPSIEATDDGKQLTFSWKLGSTEFIKVSKSDTTIKTPMSSFYPDTVPLILRVEDNDGNSVEDTMNIIKDIIFKQLYSTPPYLLVAVRNDSVFEVMSGNLYLWQDDSISSRTLLASQSETNIDATYIHGIWIGVNGGFWVSNKEQIWHLNGYSTDYTSWTLKKTLPPFMGHNSPELNSTTPMAVLTFKNTFQQGPTQVTSSNAYVVISKVENTLKLFGDDPGAGTSGAITTIENNINDYTLHYKNVIFRGNDFDKKYSISTSGLINIQQVNDIPAISGNALYINDNGTYFIFNNNNIIRSLDEGINWQTIKVYAGTIEEPNPWENKTPHQAFLHKDKLYMQAAGFGIGYRYRYQGNSLIID